MLQSMWSKGSDMTERLNWTELNKLTWKKTMTQRLEKQFQMHQNYWSVQFSCSLVCDSLWPQGLQHARLPCTSPTPRDYCSKSCLQSWWCHPIILSFVAPFSSHLQSFPASGAFPVSQFFPSGSQSIGVSASAAVLPMNIQDQFPLGLTSWISL